jgi:glycosyltransferase involved in cell wall biosynthesis
MSHCDYPATKSPDGPVITALIPTYRRPILLERAMRSVLSQTYPQLRLHIFDNASQDETKETVLRLAKSDSRISYFCHSENVGPMRNFAHAMTMVNSPFFSLLSDDDVLLPRFYETAMEGFLRHPQAMISATTTLQMDEHGQMQAAPLLGWKPGLHNPPDGMIAMLDHKHPEWTSIVFRREVLIENGGLDQETGLIFDLDYELRIAARFPIVVSHEPGAIFVSYDANPGSCPRLNTTWPGWLKMIRNLSEDPRIPLEARTHAREVLTKRLKKRLFSTHGISAILREHWQDSYGTAEILRSRYGLRMTAAFLALTTMAAQYLPAARSTVALLCSARRRFFQLLTRYKVNALQEQFGDFGEYLHPKLPPTDSLFQVGGPTGS